MDMDLLNASCEQVLIRCPQPSVTGAAILGSGWSDAVSELPSRFSVAYGDIGCLGAATVKGHDGTLTLVEIGGHPFLLFLGRRHHYEGQGVEPIAFPVYLASRMSARFLLLTNAAGGIHPDLQPGSLMAIEDHINAMGFNPLGGRHHPEWGVRFPDLSATYDAELRAILQRCAHEQGTPLAAGVYLATSGPSYETPAEIRAYRTWGADAVGMSTVPEAILARAAGIRVAGLSCITNRAAGTGDTTLTHDEVVSVTEKARPIMKKLLIDFLAQAARSA